MPRHSSVLILFNQPVQTSGTFSESQAGVLAEVDAVVAGLDKIGTPYRRLGVTTLAQAAQAIAASPEDVVFNLVEGFGNDSISACLIPALCRAFGKGFTGSDTAGLLLSLDKWQSKAVLTAAGLACPKAVMVQPGEKIVAKNLPAGHYIVKPVCADASEGIDNDCIVRSAGRTLAAAVNKIHRKFNQPAVIEQFIDGRELNVSVLWQKGRPQVLPLAEIDFGAFGKNRPRIVGYNAKWKSESFEFNNTPRIIPAPLSESLAGQIRRLAIRACQALGCNGYARVDFRLDRKNRPFILEVNTNPDISPDAGFAAALAAGGISYRKFVKTAIADALAGLEQPAVKRPSCKKAAKNKDVIRFSEPQDVPAVIDILAGTKFFRPDEIAVAEEVIADAAARGPAGHYQSFVIQRYGRIVGWVCFGPAPCTVGSFDIYWIAVDKQF